MWVKTIIISVICTVSLNTATVFADDHVLTEEEVKALLFGQPVRGIYLDGNRPFIRYYDENGEVRQNVEQASDDGKWFVDKQGHPCII